MVGSRRFKNNIEYDVAGVVKKSRLDFSLYNVTEVYIILDINSVKEDVLTFLNVCKLSMIIFFYKSK